MSSPGSSLENSSLFLLSQAALSFMIATPAVLSNVLLLVTVFRDRNRNQLLRGTSPATLLVVNLAACDLLAGAVSGYGSLYYNIALLAGKTREELFNVFLILAVSAIVTNAASSLTIAAMSFDRLFIVCSPLQYKARLTKTKIKSFIVAVWIYSILFSSLPLTGLSGTLYVALYCHIHVTVPLIILPVVYWKTYRALRSHNNQVRDQMNLARRNTERKMVSAFLFVVASFFLVFAPQYIAQHIYLFFPSVAKRSSFKIFLFASNKIIIINCILNPFIYAWRIPKFRRAFMAVFGRCDCRSRNAVGDVLVQRPRR